MKIQRKIWNYILIFVLGMMGMITIIFFLVEKLLGDGRCYIPQSAIMIALMLCVFWQVALITVACLLGRRIKKIFHGVVKMMMTIVTVSGTLCLVLFLAWNWLIYSFKFDEKVEQYDEHIALYVNNTFVRTRFRYCLLYTSRRSGKSKIKISFSDNGESLKDNYIAMLANV